MNLKTFHTEFPSDAACLDYIFRTKYPDLKGYTRVAGRTCYQDSKGRQIYPLNGTIFAKSPTPLRLWFHAILLFSVSKNGISAAELSRQLGVSYNCAWRMGMKIRGAMKNEGLFGGIVEVDETYVGGHHRQKEAFSRKKAVFGMLERGGRVRALVVPHRGTEILIPAVLGNIERSAHVMSDEFRVYDKLPRLGYRRSSVKHGKGHYVRGDVHINGLEGFWGNLKPSLTGTHRQVRYLQSYLNEHAYRYNHRGTNPFPDLLSRAVSLS